VIHPAPPPPRSPRLVYRPLEAAEADAFHRLATDKHVRRFLMDGQVMTRAWCKEAIAAGQALVAVRGVGLWLVAEAARPAEPIGFCGFHVFPEIEPEPQLLYALREAYTGRGYATEIARALLEQAHAAGLDRVLSAVDEPNVASSRVLEKVGFRRRGDVPGAFGRILLFVHGAAS
jgi:[ribosomal protein S5]-alanine N-acetyltransferase